MQNPIKLTSFEGLIDSTLREGSQSSLFNLTIDEHIEVAKMLGPDGFNIDQMEINNPSNPYLQDIATRIIKLKSRPKVIILARNHPDDVNRAIQLNPDALTILCTTDEKRLKNMEISFEDHISVCLENIKQARKYVSTIRIVVEDFFRLPKENAFKLYKAAILEGANIVYIADTNGNAFPHQVEDAVQTLKKQVNSSIKVAAHFHNSTINPLIAINAGASYIDTTLLGIGDKNGITPLSSLIRRMLILDEKFVIQKYNTSVLTYIENKFANMLNIPVPHYLVTAPSAFTHKAGIHINSILNQGPEVYEDIKIELIGQKRSFIVNSPISGKTTVGSIKAKFPDSEIIDYSEKK